MHAKSPKEHQLQAYRLHASMADGHHARGVLRLRVLGGLAVSSRPVVAVGVSLTATAGVLEGVFDLVPGALTLGVACRDEGGQGGNTPSTSRPVARWHECASQFIAPHLLGTLDGRGEVTSGLPRPAARIHATTAASGRAPRRWQTHTSLICFAACCLLSRGGMVGRPTAL